MEQLAQDEGLTLPAHPVREAPQVGLKLWAPVVLYAQGAGMPLPGWVRTAQVASLRGEVPQSEPASLWVLVLVRYPRTDL